MAQCQYIKDDGEQCGANAVTGSDYCQHHPPDDEPDKVVEAGGKDTDPVEGKAIGVLEDVMENGRGPSVRCRAAEAVLAHKRWREEQG